MWPVAANMSPCFARSGRSLRIQTCAVAPVRGTVPYQSDSWSRNAFWPIMGRLFGAGPELPYGERQHTLCAHGVAVWDVLRECHREGSLDTSIRGDSEAANDFVAFFRAHRRIGAIFFNGQKAQAAFRRHVLPAIAGLGREFRYIRLPSTSPAHAGRSFDQKLAAWRQLARVLESE